ncbi:unnamed protein product [Closterium sp. NIES-65]|nr:unnamed protein product [Closterium sp. NIES-65]
MAAYWVRTPPAARHRAMLALPPHSSLPFTMPARHKPLPFTPKSLQGFEAGGQETPSTLQPWLPIGSEPHVLLRTERSSPFPRNPIALRIDIHCSDVPPQQESEQRVGDQHLRLPSQREKRWHEQAVRRLSARGEGLHRRVVESPHFPGDATGVGAWAAVRQWLGGLLGLSLGDADSLGEPTGRGVGGGGNGREGHGEERKEGKEGGVGEDAGKGEEGRVCEDGVGVLNPGYWGMSIEQSHTYNIILHARATAPLSLRLSFLCSPALPPSRRLSSVPSVGSAHISNPTPCHTMPSPYHIETPFFSLPHIPSFPMRAQYSCLVIHNCPLLIPSFSDAASLNQSMAATWHRYEATVAATGTCHNASLAITTGSMTRGTLWLDQISAMPAETFKAHSMQGDVAGMLEALCPGLMRFPGGCYVEGSHGMRMDIATMLQGLSPGFMRFPGGCYVEGVRLANAFRWRSTIGPWELRPGHFNDRWGYWSDDGLGFFEYLQFAEDLGATPIWVFNSGNSHTDSVFTGALAPFIQVTPFASPSFSPLPLPCTPMHPCAAVQATATLTACSQAPSLLSFRGLCPSFVLTHSSTPILCVPLCHVAPQEVLDGIEFARGPSDSRWGVERAAMGHPEPFDLRHVGIGNENCYQDNYRGNFLRFRAAIKAAYPDMAVVYTCDVSKGPLDHPPTDLYDFHCNAAQCDAVLLVVATWLHVLDLLDVSTRDSYGTAEGIFSLGHYFDDISRDGPKVTWRAGMQAFLSEFAVQGGGGDGNVRAAVAEAGFLIGLERNSDVVAMVSYAPLLVNVHDRSWTPDLIAFDSHRLYGTPTYWLHRMLPASN